MAAQARTSSRPWEAGTPDLHGLRIQPQGEEKGNADDRDGTQQELERPHQQRESPFVLQGVVQFALLAWALVDIVDQRRRRTERRRLEN
jgi:hypothetical protein